MADMHPVDRAVVSVENKGLAAVLAAPGHAMFLKKERESAERSESETISIKQTETAWAAVKSLP